jgi:hypothetical protein
MRIRHEPFSKLKKEKSHFVAAFLWGVGRSTSEQHHCYHVIIDWALIEGRK